MIEPAESTDIDLSQLHHDRYQIKRVIGRGGMGVVLLCRDRHLQREIAMKVVSDRRLGDPIHGERFIEEAQINGQLEHPGIVPVYDIGRLSDDRMFFAMKLIEGQTLAEAVRKRERLDEDTNQWITVFKQVCQAVAFAHNQGVIHRDLKPSNVMLGAFGEVQVMDWGVAKVRHDLIVSTESTSAPIQTIRNGFNTTKDSSDGSVPGAPDSEADSEAELESDSNRGSGSSATHQGSVIGTLAFMPPEQAKGQVQSIDQRSDVFALGGILCQIISGQPPYVFPRSHDLKKNSPEISHNDHDQDNRELLWMAIRGDLADCLDRIDRSPYPDDLKQIALTCLSIDPTDRPADAGMVAGAITDYQRRVRERLRVAEQARFAADIRAEQFSQTAAIEIRRRRWAVASLVLSVLVVMAIFTASLLWQQNRFAFLDRFEQLVRPTEEIIQRVVRSETVPRPEQLALAERNLKQAGKLVVSSRHGKTESKRLNSLNETFSQISNWSDLVRVLDVVPSDQILLVCAQHGVSMDDNDNILQSTHPLAHQWASLPRWVSSHLQVAFRRWLNATKSETDTQTIELRTEISQLLDELPDDSWAQALWESIEQKDIPRMIELAEEEAADQQPDCFLMALADALIRDGNQYRVDCLKEHFRWHTLVPSQVVCSQESIPESLQDGSIRLTGYANAAEIVTHDSLVKFQSINAIRIDTYTESRDSEGQRRKQKLNDVDGCLIGEIEFLRTETDDSHTNGLRVAARASAVMQSLKVTSIALEHSLVPSRGLDKAIDGRDDTFWSVMSDSGDDAGCSAYFLIDPQRSQYGGTLRCQIAHGDPYLLGASLLSRYRVSCSYDDPTSLRDPQSAATGLLERMIRRRPRSPRVLTRLAELNSRMLPPDEPSALSHASMALSLRPDDRQVIELLTRIVLQTQPNSDDQWYQRLLGQIERFPDRDVCPGLIAQIAEYQIDRGHRTFQSRPSDSIDGMREALRLAPDRFRDHGKLGFNLAYYEDRNEAEHVFRVGLQVTPLPEENVTRFVDYLLRADRFDEAFDVIRQIDPNEPAASSPAIQRSMAILSLRKGRHRDADRIMRDLVSQNEMTRELVTNAIGILASDGESNRVLSWHQWALTESPPQAETWQRIGCGLIATGHSDLLAKDLRSVLRDQPELGEAIGRSLEERLMNRKGDRFHQIETPDNAAHFVGLIHELQPPDDRGQLRAAMLAMINHRLDDCREHLQKLGRPRTPSDQVFANVIERLADRQTDPKSEWSLPPRTFIDIDPIDRDLVEWLWWEYRVNPESVEHETHRPTEPGSAVGDPPSEGIGNS